MTGKALPVEYVSGRFFVCPVTTDGHRLRLFTDTGGGLFLTRAAVERLGLGTEKVAVGDQTVVVTDMPKFNPAASVPGIVVDADPRFEDLRGRLLVQDDDARSAVGDGMLGQVWFGGRVWTFDYPARALRVHELSEAPQLAGSTTPIGFPTAADGRRAAHLPSIEATIDGETHAFLFDTGATVRLSDDARIALGGGASECGTCFCDDHRL